MVKRPGVGGEGRGDLGVRFDRLNELRVGQVPEPAEGCRNERGILLYGVPYRRIPLHTEWTARPLNPNRRFQ